MPGMRRREFVSLFGGGGSVAARGAGATGGKTADDRFLGCCHVFDVEAVGRCFRAAATRTWLGRRSDNRDRVSLGGWPQRAI